MPDSIAHGILILAILVFVVLPVGAIFAFAPHLVIRLQARFYRTAYKDVLKQTDAEIDKPLQLPWDKKLMGDRSEFLSRGYENPKSYKQLMRIYRLFGFFILVTTSCTVTFATIIAFSMI